jgi:hypothetical protein
MEVKGPNKTGKASESKKKDKSHSTGDSSFKDMVSDGTDSAQSAGQSQALNQIDALLALQGAEDPAQKSARKRMRTRANTILDELDKMRMGILSGRLTIGEAIGIADVVASHRDKITDPELTAVLDEIDLRAQVELAKVRAALDAGV